MHKIETQHIQYILFSMYLCFIKKLQQNMVLLCGKHIIDITFYQGRGYFVWLHLWTIFNYIIEKVGEQNSLPVSSVSLFLALSFLVTSPQTHVPARCLGLTLKASMASFLTQREHSWEFPSWITYFLLNIISSIKLFWYELCNV